MIHGVTCALCVLAICHVRLAIPIIFVCVRVCVCVRACVVWMWVRVRVLACVCDRVAEDKSAGVYRRFTLLCVNTYGRRGRDQAPDQLGLLGVERHPEDLGFTLARYLPELPSGGCRPSSGHESFGARLLQRVVRDGGRQR